MPATVETLPSLKTVAGKQSCILGQCMYSTAQVALTYSIVAHSTQTEGLQRTNYTHLTS